ASGGTVTFETLLPLALAARGAAAARSASTRLLLQPPAVLAVHDLRRRLLLLLCRLHVRAPLCGGEPAHRLLHRLRVRVRRDRVQLLDRRRELRVLPLDRLGGDAREEPLHE